MIGYMLFHPLYTSDILVKALLDIVVWIAITSLGTFRPHLDSAAGCLFNERRQRFSVVMNMKSTFGRPKVLAGNAHLTVESKPVPIG